jgi:SAM-dependent methyltransferase
MHDHEPFDLNRRHWDEAAEMHLRGNVYGVEDFRAGGCRLHRIEVEELGDVRGKSLLHLQCHFGLDTLSWARRGAKVTGVDFSQRAIDAARRLSAETGVPGRFVCCNLYDARNALDTPPGSFDIVFTSYGAICWLPDLTRWAEIIAHYLRPGGVFYMVEAHPFARVFPIEDDLKNGAETLRPFFSYFHERPGTYWPPGKDYADSGASHTAGEHTWQHGAGDVINALIGAGLSIEFFHEFPVCAWPVIAGCVVRERFSESHAYWGLPELMPQLPLLFSVRARKL